MKDVLSAITTYRQARGWTEYQLAERSGLPQSTISSWYRKNMIPTIPSLEKICAAFGITLSPPGISRKNGILFIGDVLYYSGIPPREPACDQEPDGQIRF